MAPTPTVAFFAGRYLLRERLGAGAAGEVWRADDPRIGRHVAIKFLRAPEPLNGERRTEWESRFLLEARAAGRLSHPGIVPVFDVGTASDGRPYIVMEVVEGRSLEALRVAGPHPTLEQVLRWVIEIAEALDAAHRRGVVHRDVKPANILVGSDGRARITDFGIARVPDSDLTRDGVFLGSPAFAAPEQLRGGTIDGRADLFALGAVLYLLSAGRRPFEGDDIAAIVYAACHLEPARPSSLNPGIGPAVEAVILRALRKDPRARFQTGREFAEALRNAAPHARPSAPPGGLAADRTLRERPAPAAPTAEDRAATLASAAAVSVVRASRAAAGEARRIASALLDWMRRTEPRARRRIAAIAARARAAAPAIRDRASGLAGGRTVRRAVRSRAWLAAALIAAVAFAILAGRSWVARDDAPPHGHVWERLREFVGGKSSRVNVLVEHGLEDGTIEISGPDGVLLKDSLEAPAKALFGVPFLSYRSAVQTSKMRLSPGRQALTVRVAGGDGLALLKTLDVQVEPRSEYDLRITVSTWPRARIGADWSPVGE